MSIKDLQPECIWRNFDALTQVPRPSGHLERVQQFLLEFARRAQVEAFLDPAGNVVMRKPATPGMENKKGVILQAHMDMVPQKALTSSHNFETDPITTRIEGDWVYADNTTLGSDDGMGVAAIMAVMEAKDLRHGPLEALITADEETSMVGANALPEGELNGEILLNLDTEDEGEMVIGSAGGVDVTATLEYKSDEPETDDCALKITVKGLRGGHSGLEIGIGRANANKLLARIVRDVISADDACLASWHCGNMRNAIPFEGSVVVTVPKENAGDVKTAAEDWEKTFNNEYHGIESGIRVTVEEVALPATIVPEGIRDNLVDAIYACHNGVLRYIPTLPDIVETSSNLAIIDIEDGSAKVKILARSASESRKENIATMLLSCFSMAGMKVELSGEYQGWDPNPDSEMIKVMERIYEREFGNKPKVTVVHAGLECSVILSKYPKLDIVSFGPTLESPHTAKERCRISTMPKFWTLLVKTLEEVPEK
ncbi:MAG: aminoacyl-histidine dipeptidase [Prevotella sp.]|nr:aminoacyl-histidine dipeptidase [Prevotella sp.]